MRMKQKVADFVWRARVEKLDTQARLAGMALGAWTIVSAFHWRDRYQFASAVITGAIIVICAFLAWVRTPWLRFVNTAAAVWLFFSPILLPYQSGAMAVNEMLVALAVLVTSFFPLFSVSADEGDILPPLRHAHA